MFRHLQVWPNNPNTYGSPSLRKHHKTQANFCIWWAPFGFVILSIFVLQQKKTINNCLPSISEIQFIQKMHTLDRVIIFKKQYKKLE